MRNTLRSIPFVFAFFVVMLFAAPQPAQAAEADWGARYWNNTSFEGTPVVDRREADINYDWGIGSPAPGVSADNFSARWRRSVNFAAGTYRFTATSDDGMRIYIDGNLILDMWQDQSPTTRTVDKTLSAGDHVVRVDYYEHAGGAVARFWWEPVPGTEGWTGQYYNSRDLSGALVMQRVDPQINFDWGIGSPGGGVTADDFSVRWSRSVNFAAGTYRFTVTSDDGIRVYLNGVRIIDAWYDHAPQTFTADVSVGAGTQNIVVEYYERGGGAVARFSYEAVGSVSGWTGQYYNNMDLGGAPVMQRSDANINFDWGTGSPGGGVTADNFSVRWSRTVSFAAGNYRFTATSDDGIRVYLNGVRIIDAWYDHAPQTFTTDLTVGSGNQNLVVEYYERGGGAVAKFSWAQISTPSGWAGQYYNNTDLAGSPQMQRNDGDINFDWGLGSPGGGVTSDYFSVRWSRTVNFAAGTYHFTATSDDGMRVFVNGVRIIDMWYDHPSTVTTADVSLGAGNQNLVVEYYERGGGAVAKLSWSQLNTSSGWTASYYNNITLSGSPALQRTDSNLNFNWGPGSPSGSVSADNFSARWTQTSYFPAATYRFSATADDGVRVWVDGNKIIDMWYDHPALTSVVDLPLSAGNHTVKVEYYERGGDALVALSWAAR